MPRNGDGSSDNGPIEGHEIVHGTDGDKTLQHTKHVAPMPEQEQGDALPGLGAGGVAAPIAPEDAEQYGTNEPRKDPITEETSEPSREVTSPEPRPSNKRQKTADVDVSQGKDTSNDHSSSSQTKSGGGGGSASDDLGQVMREKAEKYVNLDEDEVNMSAAGTEEEKREARADRRADALGQSKGAGHEEAQKYGGHADVEELHGATEKTSGGNDHPGGKSGGSGQKQASGNHNEGGHTHGGIEGNKLEQVQRHQAEKFGVNLQNE